jgi:hypothetical protein
MTTMPRRQGHQLRLFSSQKIFDRDPEVRRRLQEVELGGGRALHHLESSAGHVSSHFGHETKFGFLQQFHSNTDLSYKE